MKTLKAFFQVSLVSGIVMILVGIYLFFSNQASSGETAGYDGSVHVGSINGPSAIVLGFIILAISIWAYFSYRKERERFDNMD